MNLKWPENLSIYDILYLELLAYREVEKIKQKGGCSNERHCESEYFVCLRLLKYLLMAFLQVLTMHTVPVPLTCTIIFSVDSRFLERKVWGKEHEYVFTYWYKMKHSLFTFMSKIRPQTFSSSNILPSPSVIYSRNSVSSFLCTLRKVSLFCLQLQLPAQKRTEIFLGQG